MFKFSVLMSVYAREQAAYLVSSLESLFSQTRVPDEVVIVEDGLLTEDLYRVLDEAQKNHASIKRVKLEKNMGLGGALNIGLKHCSFDLIARMDSDDICHPTRFERQLEVFEKYSEVQVVSGWISEFTDDIDSIVSVKKLPEYSYEIYKYGQSRCPVNHPSVMFKKEAVLFAGGYRPFPLFEDYYLWARMLMNGAKFYNIQESILYFRTTPGMYRRRGGVGYAMNNIRFQKWMYSIGYISFLKMVKSIMVRSTISLAPNKMREIFYKRFLRN